MVQIATYLWELANLKLDDTILPDGSSVTWMQAFPFGLYEHPVYGKIDSNLEFATRMCSNIKSGARGQELDIDYDHKAVDGKAAGWVKDAQVRPDGLWIAVEWTPDAKASIAKKEYRYFSPEFVDSWKHPRTGEVYKDVLFGGAITNRPFLKDIQPINMSELFSQQLKEESVDPKALRKMLGLPEDATDEKVTETVQKAAKAIASGNEPEPKPEVKPEEKPEVKADAPDPELVALSEKSPAIARMLAEQEANRVALAEANMRIATVEAANRLSEVALKLSEINSVSTKRQLTPAQITLAKSAVALAPVKLGDAFMGVLHNIVEKGLIELGERGGQGDPEQRVDNAKKYLTEVEKLQTGEGKLSAVDAATKVAREMPELWDAYNAELMGA